MKPRKCFVAIKGKSKEWYFMAWMTEKEVSAMSRDGVEAAEVLTLFAIPEWACQLGVDKAVRFLWSIFNFRNPFNDGF